MKEYEISFSGRKLGAIGLTSSFEKVTANITAEELALLEACKTEQEWNATCDLIKDARNGDYPPDWFRLVIQSGMTNRIAKRWELAPSLQSGANTVVSGFEGWGSRPPRYNGSGTPCDMWTGPCQCGATHIEGI